MNLNEYLVDVDQIVNGVESLVQIPDINGAEEDACSSFT
jgi:hypothetical protein